MCCAGEILLDTAALVTAKSLSSIQIKRDLLSIKATNADVMMSGCDTSHTTTTTTTAITTTSSSSTTTEEQIKTTISENDLFVAIIKLGYGKGGSDPVTELTTFYSPIKLPTSSTSTSTGNDGWEIGSLPPGSYLYVIIVVFIFFYSSYY